MKVSLILGLLLCFAFASAQTLLGTVEEGASVPYSGTTEKIVAVPGGSIAIGDGLADIHITRYDVYGNVLQFLRYDSPQMSSESGLAIKTDATGNVYILLGTPSNLGYDLYVIKFNANLVLQYERRIPDVNFGVVGNLEVTPTGSFYVSYTRGTDQDTEIRGYAGNGNLLWTFLAPLGEKWRISSLTYNGGALVLASGEAATDAICRGISVSTGVSSFSIVTGDSPSSFSNALPASTTVSLGIGYIKPPSLPGEIRVARREGVVTTHYNIPSIGIERIAPDAVRIGSIVYFHSSRRFFTFNTVTNALTASADLGANSSLAKMVVSSDSDRLGCLSENNKVVWHRKSDLSPISVETHATGLALVDMAQLSNGTYQCVGAYQPAGGTFIDVKPAIAGFGLTGTLLYWDAISGSNPFGKAATAMTTDSQGFLYVLSSSFLFSSQVTKYNSAGTMQWTVALPPLSIGTCIKVSGDDLYVGGAAVSTSSFFDKPFLKKFNRITGAEVWSNTAFAPVSSSDNFPQSIVVTPSGSIALGASTKYYNSCSNPMIAVFESNTGAMVWRRILGTNLSVSPSTLEVAANGHLYMMSAGWQQLAIMAYTSNGNLLFSGTESFAESTSIVGTKLLPGSWLTVRRVDLGATNELRVRELHLTTGSIIRQMTRTVADSYEGKMISLGSNKVLLAYRNGNWKLSRWDYGTNTVDFTANFADVVPEDMMLDANGDVLINGPEVLTGADGNQRQATLLRLNADTGAQLALNRVSGLISGQDAGDPLMALGPFGRVYTSASVERRNQGAKQLIMRWITPVAPVASNNSFTVKKNTALTVAAPGVLAGDTDANGEQVTAQLVTGPIAAQGSLALNANGSFTFTPATNFLGNATFTYRARDPGGLLSNVATVTISVTN